MNDKDTIVMKLDFPSQYTKKTDKFLSETGQQELQEYEYSVVKNIKELVPAGKTNIYERIQAEADAVDINKLMLRFQNGETDVFDRVSGIFFDASDMPTTYADMFQRVIDAENAFATLAPELREAFNNSPIEFFEQFGSDEFNAKIEKLYPKEVNETVVDVVDENGPIKKGDLTNE